MADPLNEYAGECVAVHSLAELQDYLRGTKGKWKVAWQGRGLDEDFPTLCRAADALGECLLVVEEVDMFCEPTYIPPEFEGLIKYGRHNVVHPLCISRSPAEVHRTVTRQSWECYCFAISEPRDLDYLRKYVGEAFADGLQDLAPGHYRFQDLRHRGSPFVERVLPGFPGKARAPASDPDLPDSDTPDAIDTEDE